MDPTFQMTQSSIMIVAREINQQLWRKFSEASWIKLRMCILTGGEIHQSPPSSIAGIYMP